jgi:hypothetical protein
LLHEDLPRERQLRKGAFGRPFVLVTRRIKRINGGLSAFSEEYNQFFLKTCL